MHFIIKKDGNTILPKIQWRVLGRMWSQLSLRFSFMIMLVNYSDILVEPEDGACQQERLGHIVEQS